MMLKYFFNSTTNFQSSVVMSFLKCSFKQSIDFLESIEVKLSFGSKCLPDMMLGYPAREIATDPVFLRASVNFL